VERDDTEDGEQRREAEPANRDVERGFGVEIGTERGGRRAVDGVRAESVSAESPPVSVAGCARPLAPGAIEKE
jgi:hypothetical protein